jgi:hypothetical protein
VSAASDPAAPALCACHGLPRYRSGACRVKQAAYRLEHRDARRAYDAAYRQTHREQRLAYYEANRDAILQKLRDRYDADPVYRLGKNLRDSMRRRRQTVVRRKELHAAFLADDT